MEGQSDEAARLAAVARELFKLAVRIEKIEKKQDSQQAITASLISSQIKT